MNNFFKDGQTVLFQGDSITDCGRNKEDFNSLGEGYVNRIVQIYNQLFPNNNINFINRGISGNRITDVIARYDKDLKGINPDFISILIGINDVWRRYDQNDPTSVEKFVENYTTLLNNIKRDMPNTKIMIIEPFLLNSDRNKECFRDDLDPKITAIRKFAYKFADYYLPLDGIFAKYITQGFKEIDLSEDGVHPIAQGNGIIAYEYLKLLKII